MLVTQRGTDTTLLLWSRRRLWLYTPWEGSGTCADWVMARVLVRALELWLVSLF